MNKRRITQILSLVMLHSSWGPEVKWLCNPVLSCHSCALSWFACPIGVMVHYSGYHIFPFLALGTVLLLGTLFGRFLCGWVCPFGFLQDLLHKIPSPKFTPPPWAANLKYLVLTLMVFTLPFFLGENTMLSFCRVCPASAMQVTIPGLIGGGLGTATLATAVRLGVLAAVLLLVIFSQRIFCKTMCPIGAMMGPLNYLSVWFVKGPAAGCVSCRKCDTVCTMEGAPSTRFEAMTPSNRLADCIVCHECQTVCPMKDRESKDS